MTRVLLCWELGSGQGHIRRLSLLAREFRARGLDVQAAISEDLPIPEEIEKSLPIHRVAQWPRVASHRTKVIAAASFGDILAELVFTDADGIASHINAWDVVLKAVKPSVVVADYAPGALLAARGRVASVNIGDSYYVPPADLPEFPAFFRKAAEHDERAVQAKVNAVLHQRELPALKYLPQVQSADLTFVANFPALDVYASCRKIPAIGPLGPMPEIAEAQGETLFGYFPPCTEDNPRIINGLLASGLKGRIVISKMRHMPAGALLGSPVAFSRVPVNLVETLPRARIMVTHGGAQTLAAAVAAGIPQVIIAADDEKRLLGARIAEAGAGIVLYARQLQSADVASALRNVAEQPRYRKAALELARQCQDILRSRPLDQITEAVCALSRTA